MVIKKNRHDQLFDTVKPITDPHISMYFNMFGHWLIPYFKLLTNNKGLTVWQTKRACQAKGSL